MYPQSLHTHSPCQNLASFSSSAALAAADFLFPKTFKLVTGVLELTRGAIAKFLEGANASVEISATKVQIIARNVDLIILKRNGLNDLGSK